MSEKSNPDVRKRIKNLINISNRMMKRNENRYVDMTDDDDDTMSYFAKIAEQD